MNALEASKRSPDGFSIQQAARDQVDRWSDICQDFLDWQQREILNVAHPSAESIEQHHVELKWLLRFGRAIYLAACDPDYPDRQVRNRLNGRLIQLEHSWRIMHDRIPDSEAQELLREVFPE